MPEMINDFCVNCFTKALKIETLCDPVDCKGYYLSDFIDITPGTLTKLAAANESSGSAYAEKLIRGAALRTIEAVETILPDFVTISKAINSNCSACDFGSFIQTGITGIIIENVSGSNTNLMRFLNFKVKTAFNGAANLILNDGSGTNTVIPVNLVSGVNTLSLENYTTFAKKVKVYFDNPAIELYSINCPVESGCGCGGGTVNTQKLDFKVTGLLNDAVSPVQYGFLPCITTECSYEKVLCSLVETNKRMVAYAMALQVGIAVADRRLQSLRLNAETLLSDTETVAQYRDMYARKYDEIIFGRLDGYGKPNRLGLKDVLQDTIRVSQDGCVKCIAVNQISVPRI